MKIKIGKERLIAQGITAEEQLWGGSCCNPQLLALDDGSALIFYSDFYYPDAQGIKRKSILCRRLTLED